MIRELWLTGVAFVLLAGVFGHLDVPAMMLACIVVTVICTFTILALNDGSTMDSERNG